MDLRTLVERADKPFEGFGLFGVVKETGVDDEGLAEFHQSYFPYQLYRDKDLFLYKALGQRKARLTTYNPFRLYSGFKSMNSRHKKKKIKGNMKGEGIIQGGVVIFNKDGEAKFAYKEDTGSDLPVEDIISAVRAVKLAQ